MPSTHSSRLERWLGHNGVEDISRAMRGWYGPPILVANVPGSVWATGDGDFVGPIRAGQLSNLADYAIHRVKREVSKAAKGSRLYTGFATVQAILDSRDAGKYQEFRISKTGSGGVNLVSNTLWDLGAVPPAGGTSAAPSGSSPTNATTGAIPFYNPSGSDTLHFLGCEFSPSVGVNTLLLYDRFFQVNHNIATDPQTVSGTPTRYQDATAKGTFLTVHVTTALGAGTPTYTITYVDQDGNTAEAAAAQTIVGSAIVRRFPFAATVGNGWHIPLNSTDSGVRSITNLDLSAASTGNLDVVLGKPIAIIPQPLAGAPVIVDGIASMMRLTKIVSSSCLALMELCKGGTSATVYNGIIRLVTG